jgi:hypothetical protein
LPPILKKFMKPDYGCASFACQESVRYVPQLSRRLVQVEAMLVI